ncbi:hypothetical protein DIN78_004100 [Escherichia coli]|nr:hypothetical protein [Escherichia coli]
MKYSNKPLELAIDLHRAINARYYQFIIEVITIEAISFGWVLGDYDSSQVLPPAIRQRLAIAIEIAKCKESYPNYSSAEIAIAAMVNIEDGYTDHYFGEIVCALQSIGMGFIRDGLLHNFEPDIEDAEIMTVEQIRSFLEERFGKL